LGSSGEALCGCQKISIAVIYHNVLFKFKEGTSAAQIDQVSAALEALPAHIPQIKLILMRENFSDRSKGFTHMLASIFESKADLEIYAKHPEHVKVIENLIKPILQELVVGDIEG
jgi:hypothetical protein